MHVTMPMSKDANQGSMQTFRPGVLPPHDQIDLFSIVEKQLHTANYHGLASFWATLLVHACML